MIKKNDEFNHLTIIPTCIILQKKKKVAYSLSLLEDKKKKKKNSVLISSSNLNILSRLFSQNGALHIREMMNVTVKLMLE